MKEPPQIVSFYSVLTDILAAVLHTVCGVPFLNGSSVHCWWTTWCRW